MRQLTYLVALDKHRHFGRAAENCHVSQPALSNGISELERELGLVIVKRNRTFQGITPEGERVIAWARKVLASLEGLRQEAELVRNIPGGHLAIGAIPSAIHPVTLLSAECRDIINSLTLDIQSLSTQDILRKLREQDIHLGLTYDRAVVDEAFDVMPLFTERYVLVADEQATLPRELSWTDVAGYPLCLLSQDMQNRRILDEMFRQAGATPNAVIETNAIPILLAEAQSGRAFSIMPLSALPALYAVRLRVHTIMPEHSADVCLVRLKREPQPPLCDAVWRLAANMDFQKILDRPLADLL
ncbi:LysR family transcriptional regulator [Sphingobium chungbukense]|nr:LysR family transcriptional regulator [Sphingobium chungbukense]